MLGFQGYQNLISRIKGKFIALVYIFEGEAAHGFDHYEVWKGDIVGEWIQAINEIHCLPYILDTRTFIQKAMDGTLPHIDYVVNLNNGTRNVSTLGLIPSVCSFLSIPCIPCDAVSLLTGENKLLSNLIAYAKKLNVPKELLRTNPNGIYRPIAFGSSIGVQKGQQKSTRTPDKGLYQEFIPGFDMTTPILYNPLTNHLEVLPSVAYYPFSRSVDWYLGEDEKRKHAGYEKVVVKTDENTKKHFLSYISSLSIKTFCRIDARVMCKADHEMIEKLHNQISFHDVFFLEINPTPTIKKGINFHTSLTGLSETDNLFTCKNYYYKIVENPTLTGFILSCAIIALIKAKYEK